MARRHSHDLSEGVLTLADVSITSRRRTPHLRTRGVVMRDAFVTSRPQICTEIGAADDLSETIAAYDAMADAYAARFQHTTLTAYIQRFVDLLGGGSRILDAGCGHGRDCADFRGRGLDPIGLDLSRGLLRQAQTRTDAPLIQGDLRFLPLARASFDGVWSCASLVHLCPDDLALAIAEFARVLRAGGALFISTRAGIGDEWRDHGGRHRRHFHLYQPEQIGDAMERAGFEVAEVALESGVLAGQWVNAFARRTP